MSVAGDGFVGTVEAVVTIHDPLPRFNTPMPDTKLK